MNYTKTKYSKINGESNFIKGKGSGFIIGIIPNNAHKAMRYVHDINVDGHKTFRYSTIGYMAKRRKKADFFPDEGFNHMLNIAEQMMFNGYTVSLIRCFEGYMDFTKKEDK